MHEFSELNQIDSEIAASPEVLGQECASCYRLLAYKFYNKDSSFRTGYRPQCIECEAAPRLSMEEHTARLREKNFNSAATVAQRHEDQEEFKKVDARKGRILHTSELLLRLRRMVPNLFVKEGGIVGDLAMYLTAEGARADWGGKNYQYLGYVHYGTLPEYSLYKFDTLRDVMIREEDRGWRTVLLRFIEKDLITEEQCIKEFGYPSSAGAAVWYKRLFLHRNQRVEPDAE